MAPAELQKLSLAGLTTLELRFDLFCEEFASALTFAEKASASFALIGTMRETDSNKPHLTERYAQFSPLVDVIDIEIGTPVPERNQYINIVKESGKLLMLSHHDFGRVPPADELVRFLDEARLLGADFTKLAAFARNRSEAADLMHFLDNCTRKGARGLSAFAMGPHGAVTRVSAALHGSLFTYGYVHESAAPGQLSVDDLLRMSLQLFPRSSEA
jgi:3-dehydroquinate dehydratase-1